MSLKSRYALKQLSSKYTTVTLTATKPTGSQQLIAGTTTGIEPGYVYAPYIPLNMTRHEYEKYKFIKAKREEQLKILLDSE
jgi:ribonucleotide reductase alpha subunit